MIPAFLSLALQIAPATTPAEARTVTVSVTDEKGGPVTGLRPEEVALHRTLDAGVGLRKIPRPGGTDPVAKESYVTKVGNQGCGVGYYK